MDIKLSKKLRLKIYLDRLEKRDGVCSQVFNEKDNHMLIWDFDNAELEDILNGLNLVQFQYCLPTIYIIESSPQKYHAYCFAKRSLQQTINILSGTEKIDLNYLRMGTARGYFTLRISQRKNDKFRLAGMVKSYIPNEIEPFDITVNEYFTSNKGDK